MPFPKTLFILLLSVSYVIAKTLQAIPADDLIPPPEDQESIVIRFPQPDSLPPRSLFQRVVSWFGFGEPQPQSSNIKTRQPFQKQIAGYSYDNPNKIPQQPQKLTPSLGYHYDDPNKVQRPLKIQNLPLQQNPVGYNYDPPNKQLAPIFQSIPAQILQPIPAQFIQPQIFQAQVFQPQPFQPQIFPAPIQLIPQPTQSQPQYQQPQQQQQQPQQQQQLPQQQQQLPQQQQQQQFNGYNYEKPLKTQKQMRPSGFNDLVSSAASPTSVYAYPVPAKQLNLPQSPPGNPCSKVPWVPMFPNTETLELLRTRLAAKQFAGNQNGFHHIQSIARPPEKFSLPTSSTYLPPKIEQPLRQPAITSISQLHELPGRSTPQPFRSSINYEYHASTPSPSNLIPPIHNAKPFTVQSFSYNIVQEVSRTTENPLNDNNNLVVNGKIISGNTGTTNSIQSIQVLQQSHPITPSQQFSQPSTEYGAPPSTIYGSPSVTPTSAYGPPEKLTTYSQSTFGRFTASQPFTLPTTPFPRDQTREGSSKIEQAHIVPNSVESGISNENEGNHQSTPIIQVLRELNISTTPQGFQYTATTPSPDENIHSDNSINFVQHSSEANQLKLGNPFSSNRETPLNLLDTPNSHFRKSQPTAVTTANPFDEHVPDFKFIKNTWRPLAPIGFTEPSPSPTTEYHISSSTTSRPIHNIEHQHVNDSENTKTKKIQIIIPYTSKNHPSPFRPNAYQNFDSASGWSNSNSHDDFNDSQESQVISSATASPKNPKRTNSRYLTKILAKNIRELLKREHLKNLTEIDLQKLQKNIDGWTEQEYAMSPNGGITSPAEQSKPIPSEYLTTTQSLNEFSTTEYPTTYHQTFDDHEEEFDAAVEEIEDDSMPQDDTEMTSQDFDNEEETSIPNVTEEEINQSEEQSIKEAEQIEEDDFKRLEYIKAFENNQISGSENRLVYETTTLKPRRTTLPPCSTTQIVPIRTTVLPSPDELWNKLKSLLSSSSKDRKEKVYVVTPQPHPFFESNESVTQYVHDNENEIIANFKSPRFLVRPTPGSSSSTARVARLTLSDRINRLQTTTAKPSYRSFPDSTEFNAAMQLQKIFNGHAHAQAFSIGKSKKSSESDESYDSSSDDSISPSQSRMRKLEFY